MKMEERTKQIILGCLIILLLAYSFGGFSFNLFNGTGSNGNGSGSGSGSGSDSGSDSDSNNDPPPGNPPPDSSSCNCPPNQCLVTSGVWTSSTGCPDSVKTFFSGADTVNCATLGGSPYDLRNEVVEQYISCMIEDDWILTKTKEGTYNDKYYWFGYFTCGEKCVISSFVMRPETTSNPQAGAMGYACGECNYMIGRWGTITDLINEL